MNNNLNKRKMNNKKLTGGGNKQKGIPPTATNFFGLLGRGNNIRIKSGMSFYKNFLSEGVDNNTLFASIDFSELQLTN